MGDETKRKGSDGSQLRPYQFKPGQSGNPAGRPPLTPKQRVLKELTLKSFQECVEAVCTGNIDDLKRMVDDPDVSALQVGIATSLLRALQEGDYDTVTKIVQTCTGKPPEELLIKSQNLNANTNVVKLESTKVKAVLRKLDFDV